MPKIVVPVIIELNGSITVEVDDVDDAPEAARKEYYRRLDAHFNSGGKSVAETASKLIDAIDISFDVADSEDCDEDEDEDASEEEDDTDD
jgi:hypothetical protein